MTRSSFRPQNQDDPRDLRARLRKAMILATGGAYLEAERAIAGMRYHPEMTEKTLHDATEHVRALRERVGGARKVDTPADYLSRADLRWLQPFRQLDPDIDFPDPYPWSMPLPALAGAGNDTQFLHQAATVMAGRFTPARRRIRVYYSPLGASRNAVAKTLHALAGLRHDGRIDVSVFDLATPLPHELPALPGGGAFDTLLHPLLSPEGLRHVGQTLDSCDLVVFLSGSAVLDPSLLARARHVAEISDRVVQPLVAVPKAPWGVTPFTREPVEAAFSGRYPFKSINGLNLVIAPSLLRQTSLLNPSFQSTHRAAQELCYRAHAHGAYFIPLAVPELGGFADHGQRAKQSSFDSALFRHLAPNTESRQHDRRFTTAKVSVYIPAFNAGKYIQRAVDSVLDQDVQDLDVCIANDGSRDDTLDLLMRCYGDNPRVKILDNPNGGIGFASNSAIRMSQSLYVGQLDSDDCLKPGAVRRLMTYLDENPYVVCAYSSCERVDADGNHIKNEYSWPSYSREKLMVTSIAHHFRMFRRNAWARTGGFREDIANAVDYDIFLKLSELGWFHHIDEILYQRRWHGENTSDVNEGLQTANTHRAQKAALERLGLAAHWDLHLPDPKTPRYVSYRLKPGVKTVVFWPDYSVSNPYQKLLYSDLRQRAEVVAGTVEAARKLIDTGAVAPSDLTFHLHWLNAFFLECETPEAARTVADEFLAGVEDLTRQGARFVWTIHNTISHDTPFAALETGLSARLAALADALHFHSAASVDEVDAVFPIPRDKVAIARHGHYIGAYPDYVTPHEARTLLGIAEDEDVIVFTGQLRGYKGVDTLIAAFRSLLATRPRARLILAGKSDVDPLASMGTALSEAERSRILTTGRFVEESELQLFLRAADVAAYPYTRILTSGSLMLALSFGVPCVVPRVGMTAEVMDGSGAGMLYDGSGGAEALHAALANVLRRKDDGQLDEMKGAARALAERCAWQDISQLFDAPGAAPQTPSPRNETDLEGT